MKRVTAIVLANLIIIGSLVDFHDVAKFAYLWQHYQQHKQKEQSFSFAEFISLHYGDQAEHHDKEEHDKHTDLPFKSDHCTYSHTIVFTPNTSSLTIQLPESKVVYFNNYQSIYSSEFSQSIWQPPKGINS